jgi:hypothetical protein
MSDLFATDIYTKLATVPALATAVGFAIGGRTSDPALTKIPLPAAWVLLMSDRATDPDTGTVMQTQVLLVEYAVLLYVPYNSQADLIATQFPLLRAARTAIHATTAPNKYRWKYIGQKLTVVNPDRMCYEQRYAISAPQ